MTMCESGGRHAGGDAAYADVTALSVCERMIDAALKEEAE